MPSWPRPWIPAPYRGTGHAFAGMTISTIKETSHHVRVPFSAHLRARRGHHRVPQLGQGGSVRDRGGRALDPEGRSRGAAEAHRGSHPRHFPSLPARSSRQAAGHSRRPRSLEERPLRGDPAAQERQHLGRRGVAGVPGHRHRHRHRQEGGERLHRRQRRRGVFRRRLRRLHRHQPALLAARTPDPLRGEEHAHQPAGPGGALRHAGGCLRVALHHQGWRLRQQVVPVPADAGAAERGFAGRVPGKADQDHRHRGLSALLPGHRGRRHVRGVQSQDRQACEHSLPGQPPDHRQRVRPGVP